MKAITVVAHPDDCVIFAWSFMHHHPQLDWSICYLTYQATDYRAKEVANFWQAKDIPVDFLGYTDDHRDIERGQCSFDTNQVMIDIADRIQDQAIVLTHDHKGDYGHLHHKLVHDAVVACHDHVITFAPTHAGNAEYCVENADYSLLEIHKTIVESFHMDRHCNRYQIPSSVLHLLKKSQL